MTLCKEVEVIGRIKNNRVDFQFQNVGWTGGVCGRTNTRGYGKNFTLLLSKRKKIHASLEILVKKKFMSNKKKMECRTQKQPSEKDDIETLNEDILKIPLYAQKIKSGDKKGQYMATTFFRKLVSIEVNPPIDAVVKSGIVPSLISFLGKNTNKKHQHEALWTITNICSSEFSHITAVIDAGAIPLMINLIGSKDTDIREQAIWAFGNISGHNDDLRDIVLYSDFLPSILGVLKKNLDLSCMKHIAWTLLNLCRGNSVPEFDKIKQCFSVLAKLIKSKDNNVMTDAIWAMSYVSNWEEGVDAIIALKMVKPLIDLLYHSSNKIQERAIYIIANIVSGTRKQTWEVVNHGGIRGIKFLFDHERINVRVQAVWAISNIAVGSKKQIQKLFDENIFLRLIEFMGGTDVNLRKEASWAIANITIYGTVEHVVKLVEYGCIGLLCSLLTSGNHDIISVVETMDNILKVDTQYKKNDISFMRQIEGCQGVRNLKLLEDHSSKDVRKLVTKILKTYWTN